MIGRRVVWLLAVMFWLLGFVVVQQHITSGKVPVAEILSFIAAQGVLVALLVERSRLSKLREKHDAALIALRESEAKTQAILTALPDLMFLQDADGTWYGYYHNEVPATMCRGTTKVLPRIGAARSRDRGATWELLGVILEAPPRTYDCTTANMYFVGGVGDFSVQLDADSQDVYFFYSLYLRSPAAQGVGVSRLAWADRDAPSGKIMIWRNDAWIPAAAVGPREEQRWLYPSASPIFPAAESWHDDDGTVDAFWGPSVHWNTYLSQYVMLLSRARDGNYRTEGIYISYAASLDHPSAWSPPVKVLNGGGWYPQVIGVEAGSGTDKVAGEWARFYMMGTSQHLLHFIR